MHVEKGESQCSRWASEIAVRKMKCPHADSHHKKIIQKQGGVKYVIDVCPICGGIALTSGYGFFEVHDVEVEAA